MKLDTQCLSGMVCGETPTGHSKVVLIYEWQGGAIFPRFGHGWSGKSGEGVCGAQGSVMSYSIKALWTNSLLSCEELGYPPGNWGDAAGSRQQSDEAYALNRIRYSYSLIHNEHLAE